jgi:hypothetical protein
MNMSLDGLVSLLKARQGSPELGDTASSSASFTPALSYASVPADRGSHAQPLVGDLDVVLHCEELAQRQREGYTGESSSLLSKELILVMDNDETCHDL